jgi:hypothetical protein
LEGASADSTMAVRDEFFLKQVQSWAQTALASREQSFGEVVRSLPGVDPCVVHEVITSPEFSAAYHLRWTLITSDVPPMEWRLPVPHPLDFDWRFAPSTITDLTRDLMNHGESIVLLGAPSLWLALHGRGGSPWLLDVDHALISAASAIGAQLRLRLCDLLRDPLPSLEGSVAFADPPWYPEAMRGFLWAAHAVVRPYGRVFLSAPPLGTRPGVAAELDEIIKWSEGIGLRLTSRRAGAVRYAMPPFERNALKAAGLLNFVPYDWRQGDLLVFERRPGRLQPRPSPSDAPPDAWRELAIEGVRIRVDVAAPSAGEDPRLVRIVDNDVLPSVSRRDERRQLARVWTSGNRVFGCAAPLILWQLLNGEAPPQVPANWVDAARQQVQDLVRLETAEYGS